MYNQNDEIGKSIVQKGQAGTSQTFFASLTVQEWIEYLLFLLYVTHDPREDRPIYELNVRYRFPYERGTGGMSEVSALDASMSAIESEITTATKRTLSHAVNEMAIKYIDDPVLVAVLVRTVFCNHTDAEPGSGICTFYFETLIKLISDEKQTWETRLNAMSMIGRLSGVDAPSDEEILPVLLDYRDVFKREADMMQVISYVMHTRKFYKEFFETLTYITKWPIVHAFDGYIISALERDIYRHKHNATIDFLTRTIFPRMVAEVRERIIALLRGVYISSEFYPEDVELGPYHIPKLTKEVIDKISLLKQPQHI